MNLGFSKIIGAIESEISCLYLPGAIKWCDENFDRAWSNLLDRFDKSLTIAIERKDFVLAQAEGSFYRENILELLNKFKASKKKNDASMFLRSLAEAKPNAV